MKSGRDPINGNAQAEQPERLMLPIAEIGLLEPEIYVGLIDDAAVKMLKARLAVEPLHVPIWVRRNGRPAKGSPFSVIVGRHRLLAAEALGWSEIAAEVRAEKDSTPEQLRAMMVAENLDRRVMRPIEHACFIMERWRDAAESLGPAAPKNQQSRAIRARWSVLLTVSNTLDVDQAVAATGVGSDAKVRLYRSIYEKLVLPFPDLFRDINAHPLCEDLAAVREIARQKHTDKEGRKLLGTDGKTDREKAIEKLLSSRDWENITAVLEAAGLHQSNGNRDNRWVQLSLKMRKIWREMPIDVRRSEFVEMAKDIPPSLVRETIEQLKERLP